MTPVTFTVYGAAEPKGSARAFKRGARIIVTSDNPSLSKWESAVRFAAETVVERAGHQLFQAAVGIRVLVYLVRPASVNPRVRPFPITRPDADKCVRAILDPLQDVLMKNDAQVCVIETAKLYTDGPAKAVVTVYQILQTSDLPTFARGAQ